MKDRISTYPGRVILTPVTGQSNTYDMTRADSPTQPGTPLNKATLLTDATAAALGLSQNEPTVNDALMGLLKKAALRRPALREWKSGVMPNAIPWTAITCKKQYEGITDRYMAVAANSGVIAYSADGIAWEVYSTSSTPYNWVDLAWYPSYSKFCIIATNSAVCWYYAGSGNLTTGSLPASRAWKAITLSDSEVLVAVASGTNMGARNVSGSWSEITLPYTASWSAVAHGNGKFVAVSEDGKFAYSSDGGTWTGGTLPITGCKSIAASNSRVQGAIRYVTANATQAAYSLNGTTWTVVDLPVSLAAAGKITYGDEKFVMISGGSSKICLYSVGGAVWTQENLTGTSTWTDVVYGSDKCVAIASGVTTFDYNDFALANDLMDEDGDDFPIGVQIEEGTYIGTGTGGTNNRNTLTFNISPQIVLIGGQLLFIKGGDSAYSTPTTASTINYYDIVGNQVMWYNSQASADYQLNTLGTTYQYKAIAF